MMATNRSAFKCVVTVPLPMRQIGSNSSWNTVIAEYDFDPGLEPENLIFVRDATFMKTTTSSGAKILGNGPSFSFDAVVLSRRKIIAPGAPQDMFYIEINLEIADKERIPEIIDALIQTFPDTFERLPVVSEPD